MSFKESLKPDIRNSNVELRNGLRRALLSQDIEIVREYISKWQTDYYCTEPFGDMYEDFEFIVPMYDLLLNSLGMTDNQSAIRSYEDGRDDCRGRNTNRIDIFGTDIPELYFIRMEQYGGADEDATITRIIFTQNLENALRECKKILNDRDLVAESKKFYKEMHIGTTDYVQI